VSLLLALLVALCSPADARPRAKQPAAPPPPPPPALSAAEEALAASLQASASEPIRHLFVLETTGTQLAGAQAARASIAALVSALPAGDWVQILTIHIRPTSALALTRIEDAGRTALADQIRALELTSARDFTDLGAGYAFAIQQLTKADGPTQSYVYLLGSFCHTPAINSEFSAGGSGCRAVRGSEKLVDAMKAGLTDRLVAATLFPVGSPPGFPVHEPGVALAEQVFPGSVRVDTTATPFDKWMAAYVARLRLDRLAPLVRSDVASAKLSARVVKGPTEDDPVATIELSAGTRFVGARLTNVRVEGAATPDFPAEIELAPRAQLAVPLSLPGSGLALLPKTHQVELPVTISGDLSLLPGDGIKAMGLDPIRPAQSALAPVAYSYSTGILGLLVLLFGVVTLAVGGLAGFVLLRRRAMRLRLGGSFSYRREGGPRRALDISDLEEAFIGIGEDGEILAGKGRGAVLALRMLRDRNGAYAEVEIFTDGVEMNRKPARRGRHRVTPGAASFQFGGYRLSWE